MPKDEHRVRLICDRRPQNSQESFLNRVFLPFCPRLRRLIRAIASTCTKSTVPVGTRESLDRANLYPGCITLTTIPATTSTLTILETWWGDDEPHDGDRQNAIVGVMMGDTNAVTVLEMAHRRQLINAGVLRTDSLLLPERPLPQRPECGDVFINDLVLFSILHFSRLDELKHGTRAARARGMYGQLAMPTAESRTLLISEPNFGEEEVA